MRASNVAGGNPSAAAAPLGPDIRPRLCVRADTIIFRSCSESPSLTSSRVCGVRCEQGIDGSHELSTQNTSSGLKITDLSMMFWSSRILPGQSYASKKSSVCLSIHLNTLRAYVHIDGGNIRAASQYPLDVLEAAGHGPEIRSNDRRDPS